MTGNSLGERFVITSYGESHGPEVGIVIDGCPAGLEVSPENIQIDLNRRRPTSEAHSTGRRESDRVEIRSGVFNGRTTGAPITLRIVNADAQSEGYEERRNTPRPGQADLVARIKFGGFEDYRGSGRFSARITVGFVAAGAVAKKLISTVGTKVYAHTMEIGDVHAGRVLPDEEERASRANALGCADPEAARSMAEAISNAKKQGDTLGGVIESVATGLPVGLGEPVFDNLDGDLSKAFFAIPSVKAVEFGAGFQSAKLRGSEYNDPFVVRDQKVGSPTNNAGGIIGGLSNGQPVVCRIAFRPPSSIAIPQTTVNLQTMKEHPLLIKGRFDACVIPRAVPIVEAMMAIILSDHSLRAGVISPILKDH